MPIGCDHCDGIQSGSCRDKSRVHVCTEALGILSKKAGMTVESIIAVTVMDSEAWRQTALSVLGVY